MHTSRPLVEALRSEIHKLKFIHNMQEQIAHSYAVYKFLYLPYFWYNIKHQMAIKTRCYTMQTVSKLNP